MVSIKVKHITQVGHAWLISHQNKRHPMMVQSPLWNQGLFWREKPGDAKSDIRR